MAEPSHQTLETDVAISGPRLQRFTQKSVRPQSALSTTTADKPYISKLYLLTLEDEDPPYPMRSEPGKHVGLCLIFNIINFSTKSLKKRVGSEKDGEGIRKTFRGFNFEVKEMMDPTKAEMEGYIKKLAKKYAKEWKCFVCFILSHGESEDVFFDKDGRRVRVSEMVSCFSRKACPQMEGKPKLFFVQMCRGDKYQEGVPISGFEADGPEIDGPIPPDELDMLVSFGTTPGYISFRNTQEGSPYIQVLLQMLSKFGENHDICSVLRRTTKHVGRRDYENGYKMCPCYVSTLCQQLIFSSTSRTSDEDFLKQMGGLCI